VTRQLITASQVIRGPGGEPIHNGAVLIDGGTITMVGPRQEVERQAGPDVHRRDFPGHTVLPGLINCHVHLVFDAGPDPVGTVRDNSDSNLLDGMAVRAQQLLDSGVTTARDLGDRSGLAIRLRDRIDNGQITGSRIVAAGPPITTSQGHCWFLGGEAEGESALRQRVRQTAEMGADLIKVMASGGQITPNSPAMWQTQFSTTDLKIIVEEAANFGLPVAAHAHGTDAIAAAVDAGVTTIEHCTWLRHGGGGYDTRAEVAATMAAKGTYACIAWPPDWRGFMDRLGPERSEQASDRFRWMDQLGVQLIPGTDAGLSRSGFSNFVDALKLYEHLGFTRERVIEMATATSAQALGLGNHVGQLAAGYSADLLVVEGDPLAELDALNHRELILFRGTPNPHTDAQTM
jgi:imidazolonepropionase-like amidohydrolase